MDLKERVKDSINSLALPLKCLLGYLNGKHDPELRLQMLPGSNVIERDYAGNKTEQYLMEVIMRGSDEGLINQVLWQIANVLGDNDFRVISKDGSFVFSTLEIASFPHPAMADTTGTVTYVFDFKITVDTFEK
ncbi:phage tail terminator protein [Limosilactobacillus portuensis]|uniref:phage tail terminator protein n=1 Tax=Limosilactobacillus portuensis TaxID=2742601 RepID=UPI0023597D79|nr:minor capsid protein [Limosilactobacillus portuensis]WCT60407.1 minor capsid protein [Limosilactobacillus portuensis]